MSVSSTITKVTGAGNGSGTSFSFSPIVIFGASDLQVTHVSAAGVETPLSEGVGASNYAVVVAEYPGTGSITYPADEVTPLPSGEQLIIKRVVTLDQQRRLRNQGGYQPEEQENALDKLTMIALQQQEVLQRIMAGPISDPDGTIYELPILSARKGKALTFDATTGEPLASEFSSLVTDFDTVLSSLASGDYLRFDGTNWVNDTLAETKTALGVALLESTVGDLGTNMATALKAEASFVDLASASSVDIGAAASRNVRITGTTTITAFASASEGIVCVLRFADVVTLTHNASSLILPTGANIQTAADDVAIFISLGSGNWLCLSYKRATGLPVAFIDEDTMSSDSATKVPSQQSVKAYVDQQAKPQEGGLLDTSSGSSVNSSSLGASSPTVIHLAFDQVSLNGTDDLLVQLGDAGGIETSGYTADGGSMASGGNTVANSAAGFVISIGLAARAFTGVATLVNVTGNVWAFSYSGRTASGVAAAGGGRKELSGALTQITLKPSGSDTFDGGQVRLRSN